MEHSKIADHIRDVGPRKLKKSNSSIWDIIYLHNEYLQFNLNKVVRGHRIIETTFLKIFFIQKALSQALVILRY